MSKEVWKTIEDFPSYEVSSQGRVRSWVNSRGNRQNEPHIIHQQPRKSGYVKVELWKNGKGYTKDVHRLVALEFIPNPNNKPDVNHIDGCKSNNAVTNLEWCTKEENMKHAIKTGLFYPVIPEPKRKPVKIVETGEVFDSITDCAKAIDSSVINILNAVNDNVTNHHSCKGLHFELLDNTYESKKTSNKNQFLYDYQMDAVNKLHNGCILCGSVGSGKSRTGLFYYFKENGGWIDENEYESMKNKPEDLYIITTAKKRNSLEWEKELSNFILSTDSNKNSLNFCVNVTIDSWNNIGKYKDVEKAFFLFDEQRIVGNGSWVKSFLKIAKNNHWILLTGTPGDSYMDYVPVFLANGFFKNRTEFTREHVIYSRFSKYPKIEGYQNTRRLDRLRDKVLVKMNYKHKINAHHEDVYCKYDISKYKDVIRNRWDPYKDEPIQQASQLCYILRRIVNTDESREMALLEILEKTQKAIIFYSFDYELELLRHLFWDNDGVEENPLSGFEVAEYNGHCHQDVPNSKKWVYLCQYTAACEGWECIKTDTIIFFSQNYSYKVMTQAAGRIDRLNTPFTDLYYYHLKSRSGIDLAISKALDKKKKFNETRWVGDKL